MSNFWGKLKHLLWSLILRVHRGVHLSQGLLIDWRATLMLIDFTCWVNWFVEALYGGRPVETLQVGLTCTNRSWVGRLLATSTRWYRLYSFDRLNGIGGSRNVVGRYGLWIVMLLVHCVVVTQSRIVAELLPKHAVNTLAGLLGSLQSNLAASLLE